MPQFIGEIELIQQLAALSKAKTNLELRDYILDVTATPERLCEVSSNTLPELAGEIRMRLKKNTGFYA